MELAMWKKLLITDEKQWGTILLRIALGVIFPAHGGLPTPPLPLITRSLCLIWSNRSLALSSASQTSASVSGFPWPHEPGFSSVTARPSPSVLNGFPHVNRVGY